MNLDTFGFCASRSGTCLSSQAAEVTLPQPETQARDDATGAWRHVLGFQWSVGITAWMAQ